MSTRLLFKLVLATLLLPTLLFGQAGVLYSPSTLALNNTNLNLIGTNIDRGGAVVHVRAYGIVPGSTDFTPQLLTLLTNLHNAGGGTVVFGPGLYTFTNIISIPNNAATPPRNRPIRITGAGAFFSGQSAAPNGGTVLELRYTNATLPKIDTRGLGLLEIDHLTLQATNTDSALTPFIKTIYTTLNIHHCGFYGKTQGTNATQDGIVLGGTGTADFTTGGINASFQGYGTVISDNYFNRVRTAVTYNEHANGPIFARNLLWSECGGNRPAILIQTNGSGGSCIGAVVTDNLIEMSGYTNGIVVDGASVTYIAGNSFYDPPAWTATAYRFTNGSGHQLIKGFTDSGLQQIIDLGGTVNSYTGVSGETNNIRNLWGFHNVVDFRNGAQPFRMFDGTFTNYNYIAPANNGVQWYLVQGTNGTPEQQFRIIRNSSTAHNFTFGTGVAGDVATINAGGDFHVNSGGATRAVWIGDASTERHYFINGVMNVTAAGRRVTSATGASFDWSVDATSSSAAEIKLMGTNGVLHVYGATQAGNTNLAVGALHVRTNSQPIAISASYGAFWNSNSALYWITATKTNLITDGL